MKYLRYADLKPEHGIPFSRTHIARLVKAELFPAPVQLAPGTKAWEEEEILEYRERIRAERDAKQSAARQRAAEKLAGKPGASVGAQAPGHSRHVGTQGQEPGQNNEKADTAGWGVSDARTA